MIVESIRREVEEACSRPDNRLTPAFLERHLRPVHDYALQLVPCLQADAEVVELAAWLHDLAAVRDFRMLAVHPITGAELARELLARHGYPAERAERVADAILHHNQPLVHGAGTPEAVCLSNADAMAQIAEPAYWLFFAYRVRNLSFDEGRSWYAERLRQNWAALIPEARELLGERYGQVSAAIAPGGG